MRFTVSSSELNSRLAIMSKIIVPNASLPILSDFLLTVEDNKLLIRASDQETTIVSRMDLIDADENFNFTIPAKSFYDSIKELSEQPVRIEVDKDTLAVNILYRNGTFNFAATSLNSDEYPNLKPVSDVRCELSINSETLLKGISSTMFATGDDVLRPVMNGVVLDVTAQDITFVATDAHKLVRLKNSKFSGKITEGDSSLLILRKKPLNILKMILAKENCDIQLVFGEKSWMMHLPDYSVSSLLIEGRFPNYNAVIPQNNPYTIWVDRLTMLSALKRVSLCTDEATGLIRLEIKDNNIQISAQNIDFSTSAQENVPCQYDGDGIVIGFKALFLMTMLSNIETKDVIIKLSDAARAALVMPSENNEGEDLLMLLMPMMIKA